MNYVNYMTLPNTTHSYGSNYSTQGAGNEKDGSWGSAYGYASGPHGSVNNQYDSTARNCYAYHYFAVPTLITNIQYRFAGYAYEYGDDSGDVMVYFDCQWFNGSVWASIPGMYTFQIANQYHNSLSRSYDSGVRSLSVNLPNCSAIYHISATKANNNKNNGTCNSYQYLYELQVNREKYEEVARIRKANGTTVRIGGIEPTSATKLRIRDNDMVRGIPLLDAGHPSASTVKIWDGSASKFLPLAD